MSWKLAIVLAFLTATALGQATSAPLSDAPSSVAHTSYQPITGKQRLLWFVKSTVGPESLAAGLFSAGISTARNNPEEYGPGWEGFGLRYGMRLTGVSTGNAMEASLGALWGEDPRYFPAENRSFGKRVKNIVVMTFAARYPDGNLKPAYARLIATPGNNFLSNTWREPSDSSAADAGKRTLYGFLGRMGGNAFNEFWPDVRKYVFHKE